MSEERVNGVLVGHTSCSCSSSDALAIYVKDLGDNLSFDGHCFSCESYFSQEKLNELGLAGEYINGDEPIDVKSLKAKSNRDPITREEFMELWGRTKDTTKQVMYRGIRPEIRQKFSHLIETDSRGSVEFIYYPETRADREDLNGLMGYKSRYAPKKRFGWRNLGKTGQSNELSGQKEFRNITSKYICLVGGEEDQVAAYQMLLDSQKDKEYDSIPVVSPTCGEGSAVKQVAANYDFFDQFDWIVIGMDNDEAGHKATEAICAVLPKDKVKIAKWSMKDPSEMLQAGKGKQFVRDFYGAEELHKSGVKDSLDALNEVEEFLTAEKITLPPYMHRIQENMRGGIKTTGHIGNVIGDTSIGKTFLTDNMLLHWILTSPVIPTIVSLERTAGEMGADLLSIYLKKNLTWFKDGMDAVDYLHLPEVQDKKMELFIDDEGKKRFYIIDEREGDVPTLMRQIERVSKKYDSKLVIFDPLTDLLRSLGTEAQEDFMKWEKFMKKEGFIFINVLHTRKPMPDKEGRIRDVGEYDALGSSTFPQSADWNMVINRDKNAEDPVERNTTRVSLPKIRGGTTGHAADLYYDTETRQQYDKEDWLNGVYDQVTTPEQSEVVLPQEADMFGGDL